MKSYRIYPTFVTTFCGPTNHRGSRIRIEASTVGREVRFIPFKPEYDVLQNYKLAAQALKKEFKWNGQLNAASLPNGSVVWVIR